MTPTPRFPEESQFYDRILDTYSHHPTQFTPEKIEEFVYQELTALMGDISSESAEGKFAMENIAKNGIILLLSLFEEKDAAVDYKSYDQLDDWEKNTINSQFNSMFM